MVFRPGRVINIQHGGFFPAFHRWIIGSQQIYWTQKFFGVQHIC